MWNPETKEWSAQVEGIVGSDLGPALGRALSDQLDNAGGEQSYPDDVATLQVYATVFAEQLAGVTDNEDPSAQDAHFNATISGDGDEYAYEVERLD